MKKLLALALALFPSIASATCSGVFQPNTYCGNNSGTAKVPFEISGSTTLIGPGSSTVGDLALWNNTTGTILKDQAPGAFTGVNDTNITISLSGSPTIALVNAMTATLGWTGTLAAARGGAGQSNATTSGFASWDGAGHLGGPSSTILSSTNGGTGQSNAAATGFATWSAGVLGSVGASATILPIANGGTNATTQQGALNNVAPTALRAGDLIYWNGSNWVNLGGNNSGTQFLQENSSGVPSWATVAGTGTVTSVANGAGIGNGTGSAITTSGTLYALILPQGRLTVTTGVPVLVANATAQTTLYYDCYKGGSTVPYYNGSGDLTESIGSCEVSDAMVSAASAGQVVSGNLYDVWWVHGGANRICLAMSASTGGGGGWSADVGGSNTARGTGYSQLDTTSRPYITNKNSITNCFNGATNYGAVSANQGTYLGTIYATANGQTGMAFSATGNGGGGNILGVYNAYNQVTINAYSQDTTTSWTYTGGSTWRKANNNANNSISWVDGLQQSYVLGTYKDMAQSPNGTTSPVIGCTNDWSSGAPPTAQISAGATATAIDYPLVTTCPILPKLGFHVLNAVEASTSVTSTGFFGSNFSSGLQVQELDFQGSM